MCDINIAFYDAPPEGLRQKYAVIIAVYEDCLLWCRHRERHSWEVPGGHIENDETALQAAARELQEETGAVDYTLTPVCWYSAWRKGDVPHSCGLLCMAEVERMGELQSEIAEVRTFEATPSSLTYPEIQPFLIEETIRRGYLQS